jgi:hypothetical protein
VTFEGIDADTSPLRFRVCFTLDEAGLVAMRGKARPSRSRTPLNAPGWFDCFDAPAIGAALEAGEATAVLGNARRGRASTGSSPSSPMAGVYGWHQLNGSLE